MSGGTRYLPWKAWLTFFKAMIWDKGGSSALESSSSIPPNLYVMTSVVKSAMAFSMDAIRRLSLAVGFCIFSNRGTRRPEAMNIARASNAASIGLRYNYQHESPRDGRLPSFLTVYVQLQLLEPRLKPSSQLVSIKNEYRKSKIHPKDLR